MKREFLRLPLGLRRRASPICFQLCEVSFRPTTQGSQRFNQRPAQARQRVLNARPHPIVSLSQNEAVPLETAERLGQHFLGNAADIPAEFAVTKGPIRQHLDDQCRPFIRDPIEDDPRWTLRFENGSGRRFHQGFVGSFGRSASDLRSSAFPRTIRSAMRTVEVNAL